MPFLTSAMRFLSVKEKTGFRNVAGGPIVIYDPRGILFYDSTPLGKVRAFNLPAGDYYIAKGKIAPMIHPLAYENEHKPMPRIQRVKDDPSHFEISFTDNPMTGSVLWGKKQIILDESLKDLPLPFIVFILYHEYGHQFYKNEAACDRYAANAMLDAGYNPEQIGEAIAYTLSQNNTPRKEKMINALIS